MGPPPDDSPPVETESLFDSLFRWRAGSGAQESPPPPPPQSEQKEQRERKGRYSHHHNTKESRIWGSGGGSGGAGKGKKAVAVPGSLRTRTAAQIIASPCPSPPASMGQQEGFSGATGSRESSSSSGGADTSVVTASEAAAETAAAAIAVLEGGGDSAGEEGDGGEAGGEGEGTVRSQSASAGGEPPSSFGADGAKGSSSSSSSRESSSSSSSSSSGKGSSGHIGRAAEGAGSAPTVGYREKKFEKLLEADVVEMDELRKLSWNGIPSRFRAKVWQLLVGYLPANADRRSWTLARKRREYLESIPTYYDIPDVSRTSQEQSILRQILVDVPRASPDVPLFHQGLIQRSMERVLYIWAIRHPATGYVQGIDGLTTPLYVAFLGAHVLAERGGLRVEEVDATKLSPDVLDEVEADTYWCLTKLLDNIQDHYTNMQQGVHRMVLRLEELVKRIDENLFNHLMECKVQFLQFGFRWMNCLLMRELPLPAIVRAWDTYFAEENGFESFHVYMCAALLCKFSADLQGMDEHEVIMFLQTLPTKEWGEGEIEPLLSQAFILSFLFENSQHHLG